MLPMSTEGYVGVMVRLVGAPPAARINGSLHAAKISEHTDNDKIGKIERIFRFNC